MQKSSIEERFDLNEIDLDRIISRKIPEYASKSLDIAYEIYGRLYPKANEKLSKAYVKLNRDDARIEIHVKGKEEARDKDNPGKTYDTSYDRICGTFWLTGEKEGVLAIGEDDGYNIEKFAEIKLS